MTKLTTWVQHKPACKVTEATLKLEISDKGSRCIILHASVDRKQRRRSAVSAGFFFFAQLLCAFGFAYTCHWFSYAEAHIIHVRPGRLNSEDAYSLKRTGSF